MLTIIREQGLGAIEASDSEAEDDSDEERNQDLKDCQVVVSLLLRAGAHISAEEITRVVAASNLWGNKRVLPGPLDRYLKKVIAAGGFTHVIAGTVEVFLVVFAEGPSQLSLLLTFTGPAFVGNVVGGTFLFALLAYAQVRDEL